MPAAVSLGLALLLLAGCGGGDPGSSETTLADAWVGPATLKLRKDIPLNSGVSVTVKHGERLEIVQRRRRFVKVRAENGEEGWIEQNSLLAASEMAALRDLNERARDLRSHGIATTFDLLNVHTLPARQSPSFTQVNKGDKMEVLMHTVMPRTAPERPPLIPPPPPRPVARKKRRTQDTRYQLPPLPSPPGPPENWLELSFRDIPKPPPEPPKPVPMDDWTLVRVPSGQAGWVLTGRLYMAIPDEVAQYAEGHRITSYFSLGEVQAGEGMKHHWLWTTTRGGLHQHDFDGFRVFIWNVRRNRYETAYIERRLKGYFPVELHPVSLPGGNTTYPGFSVCVENAEGERYRRSFAFVVNVVRFAAQGPCKALPPIPTAPPQLEDTALVATNERPKSTVADIPIYGRFLDRIGQSARRLFGGEKSPSSEETPQSR